MHKKREYTAIHSILFSAFFFFCFLLIVTCMLKEIIR